MSLPPEAKTFALLLAVQLSNANYGEIPDGAWCSSPLASSWSDKEQRQVHQDLHNTQEWRADPRQANEEVTQKMGEAHWVVLLKCLIPFISKHEVHAGHFRLQNFLLF